MFYSWRSSTEDSRLGFFERQSTMQRGTQVLTCPKLWRRGSLGEAGALSTRQPSSFSGRMLVCKLA
jgi:hypothetical protein